MTVFVLVLGLMTSREIPASHSLANPLSNLDRSERMYILMVYSEDLEQIKNEWRRFWMNDQPSGSGRRATPGPDFWLKVPGLSPIPLGHIAPAPAPND